MTDTDLSQFTDEELNDETSRRFNLKWAAEHRAEMLAACDQEMFDAAWAYLSSHQVPEEDDDEMAERTLGAYSAAMRRHPDADMDDVHFVVASAVWGWWNGVDVEDIAPKSKAGSLLCGYGLGMSRWENAYFAISAISMLPRTEYVAILGSLAGESDA